MDNKEINETVDVMLERFESRQAEKEAKTKADEATLAEIKVSVETELKAGLEKEYEEKLETWKKAKGSVGFNEVAPLGSGGETGDMDAFKHYIATGDDVVARKALQEDDGGEGGYLVPDDFNATIISKRDPLSWPRMAGVQTLFTNRDKIDIPAESTSFAKFTRTAEEAGYTTNDPAFAQNQVTVHKWTKMFKISEELSGDNAVGLDGWLATAIARSVAQTEAYYCAIGSGTNQHLGVFEGGDTDALAFDSAAQITPEEIWELFYTLGTGYHANAIWLMDPQTWRYLLSLRDTSNWAFSSADMASINVDGASGELLGKKVFLQDDIPVIATGVCVVMVGDPFYYALVERQSLSVRRLNELYAANGQIGFKCDFRQGGTVLVEEAFVGGVMA